MSDKPKKPPVKLTDKQREALDKGRKSFKSGDKWSEEQHAKGVVASVQKRQEEAEKRTFAALLAEALAITNAEGKTRKHGIAEGLTKALEHELAKKNPNAKAVNALYTAIRDTIGEMPSQKIDLNANVKTIGNWRELPTNENGTSDSNDSTAKESDTDGAPGTASKPTEAGQERQEQPPDAEE